MHHPTDRIGHYTAFVTPVVEHWLERETDKTNKNIKQTKKEKHTKKQTIIQTVSHKTKTEHSPIRVNRSYQVVINPNSLEYK